MFSGNDDFAFFSLITTSTEADRRTITFCRRQGDGEGHRVRTAPKSAHSHIRKASHSMRICKHCRSATNRANQLRKSDAVIVFCGMRRALSRSSTIGVRATPCNTPVAAAAATGFQTISARYRLLLSVRATRHCVPPQLPVSRASGRDCYTGYIVYKYTKQKTTTQNSKIQNSLPASDVIWLDLAPRWHE